MTCIHIVKDDTSGILGKKFGCDTLIFVLYAFEYGRKQSAF